MRRVLRRVVTWGGVVLLVSSLVAVVWLRPFRIAAFDPVASRTLGERYDVRILRDSHGVPHIYGRSDADVAFGLAYAHSEDDFRTIQQSLMTSRGRLALVEGQ